MQLVGDDEHVDQLCRVVLHLDGVDQVADDRAFVAGRNDDGVSVVLFRDKLLRLAREHDKHVVELIGIANGKRDEDAEVEDIHKRYLREELVEHQPLPLTTCGRPGARANFDFAASVRGTSVQTFWIIAALSGFVHLTRESCSRNAFSWQKKAACTPWVHSIFILMRGLLAGAQHVLLHTAATPSRGNVTARLHFGRT